MPPQTRAASRRVVAPTPLDALPLALCLRILLLLPVDARLRAAAVCRSWRAMLAERSLWTRLNLSKPTLARNPTLFLRAAAARAGGQLETLRIRWWGYDTFDMLLIVLGANAGSMRELTLFEGERPESGCTCGVAARRAGAARSGDRRVVCWR
jgi:hypothetical protein